MSAKAPRAGQDSQIDACVRGRSAAWCDRGDPADSVEVAVSGANAWRAAAAYLYVLRLDALSLAWEYLRRNPNYRRAWTRNRHANALASNWGLAAFENPDLDARAAQPLWRPRPHDVIRLMADPQADCAHTPSFSLWRIAGRKELGHDGHYLLLWIGHASGTLRIAISDDLGDGDGVACVVPLGAHASADGARSNSARRCSSLGARAAPRRSACALTVLPWLTCDPSRRWMACLPAPPSARLPWSSSVRRASTRVGTPTGNCVRRHGT